MHTLSEQLMDKINISQVTQTIDFLFESLDHLLDDLSDCLKMQKLIENSRHSDVLVALESSNIEVPYKDTDTLNLTFSSEGIVSDIYDGIKKILKAIWEGIMKVYRFIFRIEKDTEFLNGINDAWLDKVKDNKYKLPSKSRHESIMRGFEDFYKLLLDQVDKSGSAGSATSGKLFDVKVVEKDKDGKVSVIDINWSSMAAKYLKEMNIKPKDDEAFYTGKSQLHFMEKTFSGVGEGGIEFISFDDFEEKTLKDLGYSSRDAIKTTLDKMEDLSKKYLSVGTKKMDDMFEKAMKDVEAGANPRFLTFMLKQTTSVMKAVGTHYAAYHTKTYKTFKGIVEATDVDASFKK